MVELGQLEEAHEAFAKRNVRVVAVSLEDPKTAAATQEALPHLVIVADEERHMAEALAVIHPKSGPDGQDTAAPTTILVDSSGKVRWTFRPDRFTTRLSPGEVLAAVDKALPRE